MRKSTFFIMTFLFSMGMFAQQTLSHSTSQTPQGGGVACIADPDDTSGSGDEGISDNLFMRSYTPSNFGFTGDFDAMGVSFFAVFADLGGSDPTVTNSVKLFTSNQAFPNGTLTEVASKDFDVSAADDGTQMDVMFDNPVTVSANTELIVVVDIVASPAPPNNYIFQIGVNDAGQNEPSYIQSSGCGITSPNTFAQIGFPDNHIILNLLGDENLSADEFSLSDVSVYPNPASDVLNIDIPSNINVKNANFYDMLGKRTQLSVEDGKVNVSNLSNGMYFLQIDTDSGSLSRKVIIE